MFLVQLLKLASHVRPIGTPRRGQLIVHSHHHILRVDEVDAVNVDQRFTRDWAVVGSQIHDRVWWTNNGTNVKSKSIAEPSIRPATVQKKLASLRQGRHRNMQEYRYVLLERAQSKQRDEPRKFHSIMAQYFLRVPILESALETCRDGVVTTKFITCKLECVELDRLGRF